MGSASETVSPLYNFNADDVAELLTRHGFKINYHDTEDGVTIIEAVKGGLTSGYTQSHGGRIRPAHATVSKTLAGIDYDTYERILSYVSGLRDRFNTFAWPEGDLVVRVLKDPGRYDLTAKAAFELLEQAGKKIGVSVNCVFDNTKNSLEEMEDSVDELSKLNPQSV